MDPKALGPPSKRVIDQRAVNRVGKGDRSDYNRLDDPPPKVVTKRMLDDQKVEFNNNMDALSRRSDKLKDRLDKSSQSAGVKDNQDSFDITTLHKDFEDPKKWRGK